MKKAVLFDLDGTLADTLAGITYHINATADAFGKPHVDARQVKRFVGNGAAVLMRRVCQYWGTPDLLDKAYRYYDDHYNADPYYALRAYDGISQMLSDLKAMGIRTAVLSNKPHSAAAPVCERLFGDTLDYAMGNREGIAHKPDIAGVKIVLEQLGVSAEECAYVGDSEVDMQTGKNAGMLTIGVSWGFREVEELLTNGADRIADRPYQIIEFIQ